MSSGWSLPPPGTVPASPGLLARAPQPLCFWQNRARWRTDLRVGAGLKSKQGLKILQGRVMCQTAQEPHQHLFQRLRFDTVLGHRFRHRAPAAQQELNVMGCALRLPYTSPQHERADTHIRPLRTNTPPHHPKFSYKALGVLRCHRLIANPLLTRRAEQNSSTQTLASLPQGEGIFFSNWQHSLGFHPPHYSLKR